MKKTLMLVLTAVLVLIYGAFALGSGEDTETTVEKSNQTQDSASVQETDKGKRTEIHKGETLNVDGFKITYDSAEKWTSDNQFVQPEDGKKFIRLHFTVVNDTKSDKYIGSYDFECYADGEKCDMSYLGDNTLSFDSISSGRKTSGYVYFEVPVNASEIEVEYETSFWSDKKAYFIVEI